MRGGPQAARRTQQNEGAGRAAPARAQTAHALPTLPPPALGVAPALPPVVAVAVVRLGAREAVCAAETASGERKQCACEAGWQGCLCGRVQRHASECVEEGGTRGAVCAAEDHRGTRARALEGGTGLTVRQSTTRARHRGAGGWKPGLTVRQRGHKQLRRANDHAGHTDPGREQRRRLTSQHARHAHQRRHTLSGAVRTCAARTQEESHVQERALLSNLRSNRATEMRRIGGVFECWGGGVYSRTQSRPAATCWGASSSRLSRGYVRGHHDSKPGAVCAAEADSQATAAAVATQWRVSGAGPCILLRSA